jgi:phage gpG-like protein
VLKAIGMAQISWITRNFEMDGGLVGGWKPLSPNTLMNRKHGGSRPLQDTGRLKQSFAGGPNNVFYVSNNSVTVGSNVVYAEAHEQGVPPAAINPIRPKTPRQRIGTTPEGRPIFQGGVIAFKTASGWVFVTEVRNHPGIPRRRMLPNVKETTDIARDLIEGVVEGIEAEERRRG